jgi:hypothetical protein
MRAMFTGAMLLTAALTGALAAKLPERKDGATDEQIACTVDATNKYLPANHALMTRHSLGKTMEDILAQRRLQEDYCQQYARCLTSNDVKATGNLGDVVIAAMFASCLRDEAAGR